MGAPTQHNIMSRRVTRSKSRDEMDTSQQKENVENDEHEFQHPSSPSTVPPAPHAAAAQRTPNAKQQQGTAKTNRSAASLFSPYARLSPSFSERMHSESMRKPDPFPDNWEEDMGTGGAPPSASRARRPQDAFGYGGQVRLLYSYTRKMMSDERCFAMIS